MTLKLAFATEQDAFRIAEIHMAAFATNGMLLAQFPTHSIQEGLRNSIARKAADDIRDPYTAVLLVQDTELNHETISFAKWSLPASTSENESPWKWPEGTRHDILDQWTERVENAKKKVLGDDCCYRTTSMFCNPPQPKTMYAPLAYNILGLAFIATHPQHERRGAATMVIKWALDKCSKERIPAYLEATPKSWALYKKLGFTLEERISMTFDDGSVYEEIGYLFRPGVGELGEAPQVRTE